MTLQNLPPIPQPLVVRIEEPKTAAPGKKQKRLRKFVAIVLIGLAFLMVASAIVIAPTQTLRTGAEFAPPAPARASGALPVRVHFSATLDLPQTATLRDPLPVHVTVQNASTQTVTATLTLAFDPPGYLVMDQDGSSSAVVTALPPGGVFTHIFTLLPLERPKQGYLTPALLVSSPDGQPWGRLGQPGWRLDVLPFFVRLRAAIRWLLAGSGLLSAGTALFWERLKKALGYA